MKRIFYYICIILIAALPVRVFGQTGASVVRDYVGLINQTYHPGIVSYFEKAKKEMAKRGETDLVKVVDIILSGSFGSGFLYSDGRGNFYVITNNHVIAQAHTVSITFERTDGTKTKLDNLKIIAVDEENDLAILALPAGQRPLVSQGLTFINRTIEEGEEVFSAGFPGLGITPVWQFGNGRISNVAARFQKSMLEETMMGPFIQHTAPIDMGNSGGPLLTAQRNAPSGYAVVGINTLSGVNRQSANYAVPASKIQAFITAAINPKPETFKAALDERLAKFTEGMGANKAVYPHIADFLSAVCIGENAEYAFEEMLEKGSRTVVRSFIERAQEDFIGAMGIAIAWTIENSIRSGTGAHKVAVKEITGSGEEYTVIFTINNKDVNSVWIREYGNWRIKTFGTAASGDTDRLERRQTQRENREKLRLDSSFHVEAGYATLFDKAPGALYISIDFLGLGLKYYYIDSNFSSFGVFGGFTGSFPAGNVGVMPYLRFGVDYFMDKEWDNFKKANGNFAMGFPICFMAQAGVKLTTSYVPGLLFGASFQYNLFSMYDSDFRGEQMKMALALTVGYAF